MNVVLVTQDAQGQYGALANFHRTAKSLIWEGKPYQTAEHLYHAMKYIFPGASRRYLEYAEEIRKASTPYKAKLLGQQTRLYRYPWQRDLNTIIDRYSDVSLDSTELDIRRLEIMRLTIKCKIEQDEYSRNLLLSTGAATIIKVGHPFWGQDMFGNGDNMIGEILMALRSEL